MQKVQKRETVPPVGRWGEREQGIIQVATQLYLQGGYENVTMAAVASAAGLSEGTLYNYFRDKQDLQLRVSLTAFQGHTQAAERAVAEAKSLREGLERVIAIELRLLIRAKELFLVWLREMRTSNGYQHSEARKMLRRFSSQLIRLFEKWNAAPDPALGLNLPMARDIVFGSLEHIVWTARVQRREDQLDVEKLSRDLAGAYLRALGLEDRHNAVPRKDRKPGRGRRAAGTPHVGRG
ncbi:MAG TPA: TetR/AcrR family transcriptional regulator [Hyphomicrobiaceae bacterium]|jgi:AcrR family transcriptional regulator|nr:TetR/AcrR family transcriptional regulator [Hyphomicrobiaceae bacterium]